MFAVRRFAGSRERRRRVARGERIPSLPEGDMAWLGVPDSFLQGAETNGAGEGVDFSPSKVSRPAGPCPAGEVGGEVSSHLPWVSWPHRRDGARQTLAVAVVLHEALQL